MSAPVLKEPIVRRLKNWPGLEIVTLRCAEAWQDPFSGRVYMIEGTYRRLEADKGSAPEPVASPPPQPSPASSPCRPPASSPLKGEGAASTSLEGGAVLDIGEGT